MSHKLFLKISGGSEGVKLLLWSVGPSLVWHFASYIVLSSFYWKKICSETSKSLKRAMLLSVGNKHCSLLLLLLSLPKLKTEQSTSRSVMHETLDSLLALLRDSVSRGFMYKSATYPFKAESDNPTQVRFQ